MKGKECPRCRETKPANEFYPDKRAASGLRSRCKDCHSQMRIEDVGEKSRRNAAWSRRNPERAQAKTKAWKQRNVDILRARRKAKHEANPEHRAAQKVVNTAVRVGQLVRPGVCSRCGKACKPNGHHEDYSKPLDVVWLCNRCHADVHGLTKWHELHTVQTGTTKEEL